MSFSTRVLLLACVLLVPASGPRAADALDTALSVCTSCHGADGRPKDATIPVIFGQNADYLRKQLTDYRSGDRDSQIMSSMAEAVPFKDLPAAVAQLAAHPWPQGSASPPPAEPQAVAVCKGCHGPELRGAASPDGFAPRLAGQSRDYLLDQMGAYARGDRPKPDSMAAMMKALGDDERKQLADYLAGI